jgi:hypothetical protein
MKKTIAAASLLAASVASWAAAPFCGYAYMSSSGGEPWGMTSNIDAMNAAFGVGNWDRIDFGASFGDCAFVYVDGGDQGAAEFRDFVTTRQAEIETYVDAGGRLFLNAATNGLFGQSYAVGFGTSTVEGGVGYTSTGTLTAAGVALLSGHGAGTTWSGNAFAHNAISSALPVLLTGENGEAVVVAGDVGLGYVMIGGQTSTGWHGGISGSNPFQLRVNELTLAAGVAAVPEPETYALLLAGLGAIVLLSRRRLAEG